MPPDRPPFRCAQYSGEKRKMTWSLHCAPELCAMLGVVGIFRPDFHGKRGKNGVLTVNFRTDAAGRPEGPAPYPVQRDTNGRVSAILTLC